MVGQPEANPQTQEDDVSLDFVGVDPNSQQDKCPAVHVDPTTGDGLFVGEHVTDPLMLAEMASHVSVGADEAVIRMPARMWPIIAEAAAGTFEKGRRWPGRVSFADLLAVTQHVGQLQTAAPVRAPTGTDSRQTCLRAREADPELPRARDARVAPDGWLHDGGLVRRTTRTRLARGRRCRSRD
ncbi:hypothetical protein GCM10022254_23630 [Actinomadura meridiana]|uniref:Uncharacterized protein n=1 Tax=Actinomadura meridiana TaxID=559626 RepID=A0ABP8BXR6_9ACTN